MIASSATDNECENLAAEKVIVVGAGIGGLCCAIDLARSGLAVTVVERAPACGGKMREVTVGGRTLDAGPTVFTMRWIFDALFADADADLDDALKLRPLETLARHTWADGSSLDLFADLDRSADAIGAFAGKAEAAGYRSFHAEAKGVFDSLKSTFLTQQKTGPMGLTRRFGLSGAANLFRLRPYETLWRALGDHFHDPRLRQLFGRYATYCGSSPFQAPATLMLVAHVEQAGVWRVEGGMARLAQALETLARRLGVRFRLSMQVATIRIQNGRAAGVELASGEVIAADAVVVNADPAALTSGALGLGVARRAPPPAPRSLSAVTWGLVASAPSATLAHHNVLFSGDYPAEFEDIFRRARLPNSPTIYVCAQDRYAALEPSPTRSPERFLVLINAPARGDQGPPSPEEIISCQSEVFGRLRQMGLEIGPETPSVLTTPATFNALFPATGGALYGQATHGWRAAFDRPGARTRLPGLYLAGGGTHPGAGVPMAALSGRLAARCLKVDRASMFPWRRGAMLGGTSTP
jgi:1-hydroxycarotenoid 3,4-desaturase